MKMKAETGVTLPQTRDARGSGSWKTKGRISFLYRLRRSMDLTTPWFWACSLQNHKRTSFCYCCFLNFLNLGIVDLQCFRCIEKWVRYIYVHMHIYVLYICVCVCVYIHIYIFSDFFSIIGYYKILYILSCAITLGLCCLSMLQIFWNSVTCISILFILSYKNKCS